MRCDAFRNAAVFTRNYADILPRQFMDALKQEAALYADDCIMAEGVHLYRAQGAAAVLNELIDTLEKGVAAPAPDAGSSDIP